MRSNADGSFEVSPNEKITVTTTKRLSPYLASFSDLDSGPWTSATKPTPLKEIRMFTAPGTVCSWCRFAIVFDFVKDSSGNYDPSDKYTVTIQGEIGSPATDSVHPPPPKAKNYRFHVSNP